jgi:dihydroflavonol-4-reductase
MKLLITGGTGFLGHHLIKKLINLGYNDIRVLKTKGDDAKLLSNFNVEYVEGDITNANDVENATKGCNVVFHLVGMISYWDKMNKLQYDINVLGTKNIVNSCLANNVEKLIYVSSNAAVGNIPGKLADENTPYNLDKLKVNYCDTKHLGELEIKKGIEKGLNAVIICPASMYGDGDIRRIHSDLMFKFSFPFNHITMPGGLAVVDVDDVAESLIKAWQIGKSGQRYLIIGENLTFTQIRTIIAKEIGINPPNIKLPIWLLKILASIFVFISSITGKKPKLTPAMVNFFTLEFWFDNSKSIKELGITYTPFKESIKRAVKWYKENEYL